MAVKITPDKIQQINEIYYKTKNKAETARQVGCSPATVTRYLIKGFTPFTAENEIHFTLEQVPPVDVSRFRGLNNFGVLCIMTNEEKEEVEELWKEIR